MKKKNAKVGTRVQIKASPFNGECGTIVASPAGRCICDVRVTLDRDGPFSNSIGFNLNELRRVK